MNKTRFGLLQMSLKTWITVIALFSTALLHSQVPLSPGSYEVAVNTSLTLRSAPTSKASQIGSIKNGELVEVISYTDGWAEVIYNGQNGYVSARYLKAYIPPIEYAVPDIDENLLFSYQTYNFLYEKMCVLWISTSLRK